jgi:superfamily II DNA or RNA helicase
MQLIRKIMEKLDESKTNLEKDKAQDRAVELSSNHPVLVLSFATGVGKSLAAIKIIESDLSKKWYILCEEWNHISNWIDEFEKHDKAYLLAGKVEIFCYASLHKYVMTEANLILDEAAITFMRLNQIKTIKSTRVIILAAVLTEARKELIKQIKGSYKEYHISISEAIEKGLLPYPKVHIVEIELDYKEKNQIFTYNVGRVDKRVTVYCDIEDRFKYLSVYENVSLKILCTAFQKYQFLCNMVEKYKKVYFATRQLWAKFQWLQAASQRKRWLADYKTSVAEKLLLKLRKKRLICFTGSIKQCNYLGDKNVVHSQTTGNSRKENTKVIKTFNNKEINTIYAVNMLRKGMNLHDIEVGLIVQLDNQKISFIQMLGRIFRSAFPECYILVVKGTIDETYLMTCMEGFDKKYLYKFNSSVLE